MNACPYSKSLSLSKQYLIENIIQLQLYFQSVETRNSDPSLDNNHDIQKYKSFLYQLYASKPEFHLENNLQILRQTFINHRC
jgi:hypothetical protein